MSKLWLFLHLLGFTLWLGGAIASMVIGIAAKQEERQGLGAVVRSQSKLTKTAIAPGALLTVLSGLLLTFQLSGGELVGFSLWLVLMQGAGVVAALLTLLIALPTAARLGRLDPLGDGARYFDELRQRQRIVGFDCGDPGPGGAVRRRDAAALILPPTGSPSVRLTHHLRSSPPARAARPPYWADMTSRVSRRAHRRSQLHQRLIEGPGSLTLSGKNARRSTPGSTVRQLRPNPRMEDPLKHSGDIRVDCGHPTFVGKAGDGARGVLPDPRQAAQLSHIGWKYSPVFPDHLLCQPMQIGGPAIIA